MVAAIVAPLAVRDCVERHHISGVAAGDCGDVPWQVNRYDQEVVRTSGGLALKSIFCPTSAPRPMSVCPFITSINSSYS